ncbi:MAG: DNA topoisomerase [Nitrososphaeraceae archaeon]
MYQNNKQASFSVSGLAKPPYTLVVCEKPDAARRIAQALGTSKFEKISELGVEGHEVGVRKTKLLTPVFSATGRNSDRFIVCSALGHLYGLVDVKGNRSVYPVFDVKWVPISKKSGNGRGAKKIPSKHQLIIKAISLLSQKATRFIHACDYDQEGEVIGYNILQYACNSKYENSLRAKFSTLTDEEVRNAFDNLLKPSKGLADAGRSRHTIDFIYGINLSRALTQSYKVSNEGKRYYNLTIGRVQGPALAFVVDREIDIRKYIPTPYWAISAEFEEKNGHRIKADYYQQKISALAKATSIVNECVNQDGKITKIDNQKVTLRPPHPFNLGDLQHEAYRVFKFSPSYTLAIAEKLYIDALISYPRTSSQKLPASINYRRIVSGISKMTSFAEHVISSNNDKGTNALNTSPYARLAANLLSKGYIHPNEGSKTDPAHPAIYPTGEQPRRRLENTESKLFDLIIRRFLATFADSAAIQHTTVSILVKDKHIFNAQGDKMIYEGWMDFYKPYSNRTFTTASTLAHLLPQLKTGDILKNIAVAMDEKFSQPPPRFNQASLLERMENEKIGTKATRSEVISTLLKRNYVTSIRTTTTTTTSAPHQQGNIIVGPRGGIEATDLGFEIIQAIRKYIPNIVSIDLTRSMEEQLEAVEVGKATSESVTGYAIKKLKEAIVSFKDKEIEIGLQLTNAVISTGNKQHQQERQQQIVLGSCPVCTKGELKVIRSSITKKRFVGCSNYASGICKATAPLPQKGLIKITGKLCSACRWPIVGALYVRQSKRLWTFCINMHCPSKKKI